MTRWPIESSSSHTDGVTVLRRCLTCLIFFKVPFKWLAKLCKTHREWKDKDIHLWYIKEMVSVISRAKWHCTIWSGTTLAENVLKLSSLLGQFNPLVCHAWLVLLFDSTHLHCRLDRIPGWTADMCRVMAVCTSQYQPCSGTLAPF